MSNKVLFEEGLTYDDVLLVPERSSVNSRTETLLETDLGSGVVLQYPVMSAAMDTVTNGEMAKALAELGGIGIIHRFQSISDRLLEISKVPSEYFVGVAVGIQDSIGDIVNLSKGANIIAIDVAHAHHTNVLEFTKKVMEAIDSNCLVMIGNIVTKEAANEFMDLGVDILKVGIGGGAVCSTRIVTGFGVPNVTAIMNVKEAVQQHENGRFTKIVADGGIKTSGDIAKAIAAGADCVMLGSLLAGADEAPGLVENGKKVFRGMSSAEAQKDWKGGMKKGVAAEGVSAQINMTGPVERTIDTLMGGLRSALTYAGAFNLEEFYDATFFIKVSPTSLGESRPHILDKK